MSRLFHGGCDTDWRRFSIQVGLTEIRPSSHDLQFNVWGCPPTDLGDRRHMMPIITPSYPAQNATANVSRSTLKIMHEEFARGRDVVKRVEEGRAEWAELFEAGDTLAAYTHFLQVAARTPCLRAAVCRLESSRPHIMRSPRVQQSTPSPPPLPLPAHPPADPSIHPPVSPAAERQVWLRRRRARTTTRGMATQSVIAPLVR